MKKSVNLNYIWSKFIVDQLASLGVKNVCISPGSRSTPLTTAFAENKKIKKFVIVDERSCGFFALGLSKESGLPTVVVTTSGTATANLYPAIIEAYQSRVPLIICTTDRPHYLKNSGANQTINQDNLYKNHIRYYADLGLPKLKIESFKKLNRLISSSYHTSLELDRGPVHLNFPFEKPLEKSTKTFAVTSELLRSIKAIKPSSLTREAKANDKTINSVLNKIEKSDNGLIFVGWDNYDKYFKEYLIKLSETTKFPILVDGASGIYFSKKQNNIIVNHQAFLRSKKLVEQFKPEILIQFGAPPTSNSMLDYFQNLTAYKFSVSKFGDKKDPSNSFNKIVKVDSSEFCKTAIKKLSCKKNDDFLNVFKYFDTQTEIIKNKFFTSLPIKNELGIVTSVIISLPRNSNLFVSNSLPIRDLEFFKSKTKNNLKLFVNRGASGIDGIISTAAGISASSNKPTFLVTGDLSFFHDSNGLQAISKYSLPITIMLINNGGGAIFGMLPISKESNVFNDYFFTPLNVDFDKIVKAYGGIYKKVNSAKALNILLAKPPKNNFRVIEIRTDYKKGISLRKDYFRKVITEVEKVL